MKTNAATVEQILESISPERKDAFTKLHKTILKNLPKGFEAAISYGGLGYVVPHKIYPAGYHCKAEEPLPFAGLSSQKASINFYHMGIYANPDLLNWFVEEYPKHSKQKLDMGKSCIRFKKLNEIPFELLGELASKMTPTDWISVYEKAFRKSS